MVSEHERQCNTVVIYLPEGTCHRPVESALRYPILDSCTRHDYVCGTTSRSRPYPYALRLKREREREGEDGGVISFIRMSFTYSH